MKPIKLTDRNIMFTQEKPFEGMDFDLNLGLILGRMNNYVIDTGFGSGSVDPILDYVHEAGGGEKPFYVVNTHSHWDHVWGNCVFENCVIIAHPLCREICARGWDGDLTMWGKYIHGDARRSLPNMTFDSALFFPDDGITIFHSPGHTEDCISVYDEVDKILYAGDNIGDLESEIIPHIETDRDTFAKLIEMYRLLPFEKVISGHNKPQGREVLDKMAQELDAAWARQNG